MKEMIIKYNDLFINVLNEIKSNHSSLISELETTNDELTKNLGVVANYKEQINYSKELIENAEKDIKTYNKDLEDLTAKFNSAEFSELISVGNKEFTNKIMAKKAIITSECNKIKELSIKTQSLKELLLSLKVQKEELETKISHISILEKYYNDKVNEMIDYTSNNAEELLIVNNRIELELSSSTDTISDSDLKLDASIFDEIENISVDDIENVEINDIKIDLDNVEEQNIDPTENLNEYLNSIINLENSIVESASGYMIDTPFDGINLETENVINNNVDLFEEEKENNNDIFGTQMIDVVSNTSVEPIQNIFAEENEVDNTYLNEEQDNLNFDNIFNNGNSIESSNQDLNNDYEESNINDILSNIQSDVDNEENNDLELSNEEFASIEPTEDIFASTNEEASIDDNVEEIDTNNTIAANSFEETMTELGFVPNMFSPEVLSEIESTFNRDEMVKYIDVLNKHNIDKAILYTDSNILLNISAQNLDHILELLEKAGTSNEDIKRLFAKLDRVMIDKLENVVNENTGDDIINILYSSMLYKGEMDLVSELNLSVEEENKLKSIAGDEEFKIMNLFPEIVLTNYNTIKDLGVDVKECFINHPHRFLYNTDRFNAILDKYDREDLIRCINKNSAVIDKL